MKIFYWAPYMGNVGTIRAVINSAKAMKKYGNHDVYLIKTYREWEGYEDEIKNIGINIIDFGLKKLFPSLPKYGLGFRFSMGLISLYSLPKLVRLINKERPDVFITNLLAVPSILAVQLSKHKSFLLVSIQGLPRLNWLRKFLWRKFYPKADFIWVLTERTKDLIKKELNISEEKIKVIPNPIIDEDILEKSKEEVEHPWFKNKDKPIVIGVGRLTRQKDFPTLIKAFSIVRKNIEVRLVILGEGEDRPKLETLIKRLKLEKDVWMPGFVKNPYKYMAKADVFVLSSLWEDPGHVLMEVGFLKIPIVSTKCPHGPEEFLEYGKGGFLCKVGDEKDMAEKILTILIGEVNIKKMLQYTWNKALNYTLERHYNILIAALEK